MDNTILLYNNALNLNLKQSMNDANDVLYNIQSLKQFQWNIDQIQKVKDGAQMQVNMAALALWRNFVLDEGNHGVRLFRNLVRKYYSLSDAKIPNYETCHAYYSDGRQYMLNTNALVIKRKGEKYSLGSVNYWLDPNFLKNPNIQGNYYILFDMFYDIIQYDENSYCEKYPSYVYKHSCYIDFQRMPNNRGFECVAQNKFTNWTWNLVKLISGYQIKDLLQNEGFFAQMGINNVSETLNHLQEIVGPSYEITEEMKNEVIARLEQKGIALYSYRPISKEFIFQHQNELDWKVMQKNPRIQWDWELINLYLRKVKETVSEDKWPQYLLGSKAMYEFVGNYLNDEILSDIEKLYNIA